jgi:hypothetical protein
MDPHDCHCVPAVREQGVDNVKRNDFSYPGTIIVDFDSHFAAFTARTSAQRNDSFWELDAAKTTPRTRYNRVGYREVRLTVANWVRDRTQWAGSASDSGSVVDVLRHSAVLSRT